MLSKLFLLFKTRALVMGATALLLVGSGATVVLAASHAGQRNSQPIAHEQPSVTATAQHDAEPEKDNDQDVDGQGKNCSGEKGDLQDLLERFHLSTEKSGAAVTAICALHAGTFKGTTDTGISVTAHRSYGFGELTQLLILAQFLATKNGVKLSDANVSTYLASALQACASSSSTTACLKNTLPSVNPVDGKDGKGGGE